MLKNHPKGLMVLFFTEMWERFGYYLMLGIFFLYMTDTARWFVSGDKSDIDLWMVWREKFQTDAADDFDTGDGKMKGYMRLAAGFGDWRGFWGSDGS